MSTLRVFQDYDKPVVDIACCAGHIVAWDPTAGRMLLIQPDQPLPADAEDNPLPLPQRGQIVAHKRYPRRPTRAQVLQAIAAYQQASPAA